MIDWDGPGDHECHKTKGCNGTMKYEDDEYGSLADGGSYEIYRCDKCERRCYVQMPD